MKSLKASGKAHDTLMFFNGQLRNMFILTRVFQTCYHLDPYLNLFAQDNHNIRQYRVELFLLYLQVVVS